VQLEVCAGCQRALNGNRPIYLRQDMASCSERCRLCSAFWQRWMQGKEEDLPSYGNASEDWTSASSASVQPLESPTSLVPTLLSSLQRAMHVTTQLAWRAIPLFRILRRVLEQFWARYPLALADGLRSMLRTLLRRRAALQHVLPSSSTGSLASFEETGATTLPLVVGEDDADDAGRVTPFRRRASSAPRLRLPAAAPRTHASPHLPRRASDLLPRAPDGEPCPTPPGGLREGEDSPPAREGSPQVLGARASHETDEAAGNRLALVLAESSGALLHRDEDTPPSASPTLEHELPAPRSVSSPGSEYGCFDRFSPCGLLRSSCFLRH